MQPTSTSPASLIQVPDIDSDEPVAVIPVASAAPLDGQPDGERINTFALARPSGGSAPVDSGANDRVLNTPFARMALAFTLGFIMARALR